MREQRVTSERAVEHVVVLPVLRALGWDPSSTEDMCPEYPVEKGRVDWALLSRGEPEVFVELKEPQRDLTNDEEQLLNYAFRRGVDLAVLTNGGEWRLYLPLKPGDWSQRRFAVVRLTADHCEDAARDLEKFLSRRRVLDGSASRDAQALWKHSRDNERLRRLLPPAVRELLSPPAPSLVAFLQEQLKEVAGSLPPADLVGEILGELVSGNPVGATNRVAAPSPRRATKPKALVASSPSDATEPLPPGILPPPFAKPSSMAIAGDAFPVKTWKEVLVNVAEWLIAQGAPLPVGERKQGNKRTLIATRTDGMWEPTLLSNGLYLETHYSAQDCIRRARWLLAQAAKNPDMLGVAYTMTVSPGA